MYKQPREAALEKKNRRTSEEYLHQCPYFTSASFARIISQMAEEECHLGGTGLSPAHVYLIVLVNDNEGISPSELAQKLNLAPSTITRMIDKLVTKGILERRTEGKNSRTYPTEKSIEMQKYIVDTFQRLYKRFTDALGKKEGYKLIKMINEATAKLSK